MTPWQTWQNAWKACDSRTLEQGFAVPDDPLEVLSLGLWATGWCDASALRLARILSTGDDSLRLLLFLMLCRLRQGHPQSTLAGLEALLSPLGPLPDSGWIEDDFEALRTRFDAGLSGLRSRVREIVARLAENPMAFAPHTGSRHHDPLPLVCVDAEGESTSFAFALHEAAVQGLVASLQARRAASATNLAPKRCGELIMRVDPHRTLDPLQAAAIQKALEERFVVLTGGPGTGKTTVVACLLWALLEADSTLHAQSIVLCAPTGRAQARLVESVGENLARLRTAGVALSTAQAGLATTNAGTLHSLLGARPDGTFRHHLGNPLPYRVLVVDEASMIDLPMFAALLDAVPPQAHLVLVGDPDQLPSVDVGAVLADLLAAPALKRHHTRLEKTFRNAGRIADFSASIRENAWNSELAPVLALEAWKHGQGRTAGAVHHLEGDLVPLLEAWVERWLVDPGFGCILCAVHGGPSGREAVNRHCDEMLRRRTGWKGRFFPGQPVILGRNHPERNLWNGDLGRIVEENGELWACFGAVKVRPGQLDGLDSAWAITIHKSQGSEFAEVLFLLPDRDTPILTQQIVYTAITRAKKSVLLWGDLQLLAVAARRREDRPSRLREIGGEMARKAVSGAG